MHINADVMAFSGGLQRFTGIDQTIDYMAMVLGRWQLFGFGKWAVEAKDTAELVGRVGFFPAHGYAEPELGWLLGRECWGQGFAAESSAAAQRWAFDALGADRIISLIDCDNYRSVAVAKRIGEILVGETEVEARPHLVYAADRPSDHHSRGPAS
jgi:ribosomal-protein-alanine N-acetyltransferase